MLLFSAFDSSVVMPLVGDCRCHEVVGSALLSHAQLGLFPARQVGCRMQTPSPVTTPFQESPSKVYVLRSHEQATILGQLRRPAGSGTWFRLWCDHAVSTLAAEEHLLQVVIGGIGESSDSFQRIVLRTRHDQMHVSRKLVQAWPSSLDMDLSLVPRF